MNRRIILTVALVGLGAGLAACSHQAAADLTVPVAATATATAYEPPPPAQGPGEPPALAGVAPSTSSSPTSSSSAADAPAAADPVPSPTVAKTQKWVKIYSGPSQTKITPPKSRTTGSHTVELNATENRQIGTYLADGAGRTLYVFDNDTADPPKSNCNGDCAKAWPPLLIKSPGKIYPKGVDPKILGYVERADGHCQVTVNGHPVYYFIADAKPGDINGQGVNGKWFAVAPNGGRTTNVPVFPSASPTR
jgi:predicted lipoprotein with Yx(FWY)xxD motif